MTDDAPALQVLETLAQRRDHLGVPEDLQRLDDALVELPRQNRAHGLAATRDRQGALRRPGELLGEIQQSLARFGNRKFGHRALLYTSMYKNMHRFSSGVAAAGRDGSNVVAAASGRSGKCPS